MSHGQERLLFLSGRVSFFLVYFLDFLVNLADRFSKEVDSLTPISRLT